MNNSNRDPELGDEVRCMVTGFTGIIETHAKHLAGCDRFYVQGRVNADGKNEARWVDIDMCEIITPNKVAMVQYTRKAPGGVDRPASTARAGE